MRWDFSIPRRAEDRWQDMHKSAQEQRLVKRVAQFSSAGPQRPGLAAKFSAWILHFGRAASRMTRRVDG